MINQTNQDIKNTNQEERNTQQENKNIKQETKNISTNTTLALLGKDLEYIKLSINEIKVLIENQYLRKDEFIPIKNIVYGTVALILTSVIGSLIYLVIKK